MTCLSFPVKRGKKERKEHVILKISVFENPDKNFDIILQVEQEM